MISTAQVPAWLAVAVIAMVVQEVAASIFAPFDVISIIFLIVVLLLAGLLLRGSRVAWVIAVLFAVLGMAGAVTTDKYFWYAAISLLVLVGLLAPASRAFIWSKTPPRVNDL